MPFRKHLTVELISKANHKVGSILLTLKDVILKTFLQSIVSKTFKIIIFKIFQRTSNSYSLSQRQQQTQATYIQEEETRMSINLPYVEGTSEKQRRIF